MRERDVFFLGAPTQDGAGQPGCVMGPDAYRTAGIVEAIRELGHRVRDGGNVVPSETSAMRHDNSAVHHLEQVVSWAHALEKASYEAMSSSDLPIFLGGDHSLSLGSVPGIARYWAEKNRPLFVLWLDAHPDMNTFDSTRSGNLHGTPVAYFTGQSGFGDTLAPPSSIVPPEHVCLMGIRSVDTPEKALLAALPVTVCDMRFIDEQGIKSPLGAFLEKIAAANGVLHVSFDVDFLDPIIAPAVGTTVPGGATFREAHLIMEMLCDSECVTSLDLVELNPFLDSQGMTASLMTDLCASLLGRKLLDRPSRILSQR